MELIFGHDHKFRLIDGKYYSTGGLSEDILMRYVNIFGTITVVARVIKEFDIKDIEVYEVIYEDLNSKFESETTD